MLTSRDIDMANREALIRVILTGTAQQVRNFAANCAKIQTLEQLQVFSQLVADAVGEFKETSRLKLTEAQRRNLRIFVQIVFAAEAIHELDEHVSQRRTHRCAEGRKRCEQLA